MKDRILKKYEGNPAVIRRHAGNCALCIQLGAIKHEGEYILMMDTTTLTTYTDSDSQEQGWIQFVPEDKPVNWLEPDPSHPETCTYDPRITKIGDEYIILCQ